MSRFIGCDGITKRRLLCMKTGLLIATKSSPASWELDRRLGTSQVPSECRVWVWRSPRRQPGRAGGKEGALRGCRRVGTASADESSSHSTARKYPKGSPSTILCTWMRRRRVPTGTEPERYPRVAFLSEISTSWMIVGPFTAPSRCPPPRNPFAAKRLMEGGDNLVVQQPGVSGQHLHGNGESGLLPRCEAGRPGRTLQLGTRRERLAGHHALGKRQGRWTRIQEAGPVGDRVQRREESRKAIVPHDDRGQAASQKIIRPPTTRRTLRPLRAAGRQNVISFDFDTLMKTSRDTTVSAVSTVASAAAYP
jgi:hypothetical protein